MEFAAARLPEAVPLTRGARVVLEPLDAARHGDALWEAQAGDPELWDYLPYGPFADRAAFDAHLRSQEPSEDPRFYAVVDRATGRAGGVFSLLRITPEHGVIEIGHVWFGAPLQRTPQATEAIHVLLGYAFEELGNRRVEWKCDAANARSSAAAQRFGFAYEGLFRQHMVIKRRNRDTLWFSMLDGEWPEVDAAYRAWLAPSNFDEAGRQRVRLCAWLKPRDEGR